MDETIKIAIAGRFRNTELGFLRIRRNLAIEDFSDSETEDLLRRILLATPTEHIIKKGKNYYFNCPAFDAILTVNSHSHTIVTAKRISQDGGCGSRNHSRF
jgi:hypothetical protein